MYIYIYIYIYIIYTYIIMCGLIKAKLEELFNDRAVASFKLGLP